MKTYTDSSRELASRLVAINESSHRYLIRWLSASSGLLVMAIGLDIWQAFSHR